MPAFSEQGVTMRSTVLGSPRSITVTVNIEIMRTFVRVRALEGTHSEVAKLLAELDETIEGDRSGADAMMVHGLTLVELRHIETDSSTRAMREIASARLFAELSDTSQENLNTADSSLERTNSPVRGGYVSVVNRICAAPEPVFQELANFASDISLVAHE